MELVAIRLEVPENGNVIDGERHFIKTVEDIDEAIVNTAPQMKFGIAFNEASGACLTRVDGNDEELKANAVRNAAAIGAGHVFVVALRDGYPINVLGRIKDVPEVAGIYYATANPAEAIVAGTVEGGGRGMAKGGWGCGGRWGTRDDDGIGGGTGGTAVGARGRGRGGGRGGGRSAGAVGGGREEGAAPRAKGGAGGGGGGGEGSGGRGV